jgi:hypothetical protein
MLLERSPARASALLKIAGNVKALDQTLARLAGSRDASGSAERKGRAYVMRVDNRARVTYAAAKPDVRKFFGARQHPATIAGYTKSLG